MIPLNECTMKNRAIYYPDPLLEITGNALNNLPQPVCWSWPVSKVIDWVKYGLKLPQYVVSTNIGNLIFTLSYVYYSIFSSS